MASSPRWKQPEKLLWGAAISAAIGVVLLLASPFAWWVEGTPGSTSFSTRGVQDPNNPTQTITVSTREFTPGTLYYYSVSVYPAAYVLPIGGTAALLGFAGWVALVSAKRREVDPHRLKRAAKVALAAAGLGVVGGVAFEVSLAIADPEDWWLDAGFDGLISAAALSAGLLWYAARSPQSATP